jgi:hypothetical protein
MRTFISMISCMLLIEAACTAALHAHIAPAPLQMAAVAQVSRGRSHLMLADAAGAELRNYGLAEWLPDSIAACRAENSAVLPLLLDLKTRRFFRFYAVDLLAGCMYMPSEEVPCDLGECEVDPVDEVPTELEQRDESEADFELDSWARWDQPSDFTEYYDLGENPEGHTGYDGSDVWNFIHTKICFQKDVDSVGNEWKGDFNRAVSGLHSTVSAQIVGDLESADPGKALAEYKRRLRDEPAAVDNLYYAYMLTLCGISAARERLDNCGYLGEGEELLESMRALTSSALLTDDAVQLAASNLREHCDSAGASSWKLRMRTRDLLHVMNCVQCNACRLHGKVMALGLAASLQVLLGLQGRGEEGCNRPPDPTSLHRVEVAAMVTLAGKLSAACELVERYEQLASEQN